MSNQFARMKEWRADCVVRELLTEGAEKVKKWVGADVLF